ncbi:MAG TPA: tRNA lysidine(34) synthetase TilS [Burkholderiaceae bacterium]|nr:tRNA lysidine(34) synthetase TilS [Burkholderiaceae bacterium]
MNRVVAVAVSGGRDSMALLHCTAHAARRHGLHVVALHVHHGLMPAADDWAAFVERTCKRWAKRGLPVSFAMTRLQGQPARGASVEAWARAGRYAALTAMARHARASLVLLAHHRGDQAETFLLQALRGAGPAGLAAMPALARRDGRAWARPWLGMRREAIDAYVRRHRIAFVDDASNRDPRFARSRLRAEVVPALRRAFPDAEATLAAAARNAALARELADEVAQSDLASILVDDEVDIAAWSALGPARRRNALRAWLAAAVPASSALLDRLVLEVGARRAPAQWPLDGATLRRYRGRLRVSVDANVTPALRLHAVEVGGIALCLLQGARWVDRRGGEQFQRAAHTSPRSLKKQFQTAGVPAWARDAPLLVAADGALLFVPGLGIDARALSRPGRPRVSLEWVSGR